MVYIEPYLVQQTSYFKSLYFAPLVQYSSTIGANEEIINQPCLSSNILPNCMSS